jgi:hypothetical protein
MLRGHPARAFRRTGIVLLLGLLVASWMVASAAARPRASGSPWQSVAFPKQLHPGAMLLLTNGSVMVQDQGPEESGASGWWLLTPSRRGSYVQGTWRRPASLPSGYGPISFASAVLPDGRVIIEGGEDNLGNDNAFTNRGAIYQPLTNRWTSVTAPSGSEWTTIGDAPATVLANGTFMLGGSGNYTNRTQALLNPKTLTWSITGVGKVEDNEEEGFTLLPSGDVLSVGLRPNLSYAELYDPSTGRWTDAGTLPVPVVDAAGDEIGPLVLRPNGTVLVLGDTGQNAIYSVATHTWSKGPSFPVINGKQPHCADAPAAVLPDGDVLIDASPGLYHPPSYFFVFNGHSLTRVASPPNAVNLESNFGYMLVLPTGQVLFNDRDGHMEVYNNGGRPSASWRPVIHRVDTTLAPGHTYSLIGSQLNGLTQGASYGDDYQSATNFPLVRISYSGTGRVVYTRTFNMSSMAVAPGVGSRASFTVPGHIPSGKARLVAVANGIASAPVTVKVK